MGAAYFSLGRTKVLYATSQVLLGAKAKFLVRKPSVLVAFFQDQTILSECLFLYRTQSSANRCPDVIGQIVYEDEEKDLRLSVC